MRLNVFITEYLALLDNSLHLRELVMCEVFAISLCYMFVVRDKHYSVATHYIPTVSTLFYSVQDYESFLVYSPKWVLQGKKFAAQKIIGKYLQFPGGDFYTPLS